MSRQQSRTWELMPRDLRDEVYRIGAARRHRMGAYWSGAIASAAALAEHWLTTGQEGPVPLPPPLERSDVPDAVDVRWTQDRAEAAEHLKLLTAAGSTRTAVLIVAARRYADADGHILTLMRQTPGRLTPGPLHPDEATILELFGQCPPGCPLVVSDRLPCWARRLLSARAQ